MEQIVKFLAVGTYVRMPALTDFGFEKGQTFEIVRHRAEIDESGISVLTDLLAVSDETAEDIGKDLIKVNLDMWDYSIM